MNQIRLPTGTLRFGTFQTASAIFIMLNVQHAPTKLHPYHENLQPRKIFGNWTHALVTQIEEQPVKGRG